MWRNPNIANSLWSLLDIFLYPMLFFISAPFFLAKLGQTQFGIWMLVTSIIVTMQVLNFGIGNAVLKNLSYYLGKKDAAAASAVISNALSITSLLSICCLALSIVGYYLILDYNLFHIEPGYKSICANCIILACVLVAIKFFELIFTSYFKALELFKQAALLGSGNRLLALCINFCLLHFIQLDIFQVLLVIVIVNLLFVLGGWAAQQSRSWDRTSGGGNNSADANSYLFPNPCAHLHDASDTSLAPHRLAKAYAENITEINTTPSPFSNTHAQHQYQLQAHLKSNHSPDLLIDTCPRADSNLAPDAAYDRLQAGSHATTQGSGSAPVLAPSPLRLRLRLKMPRRDARFTAYLWLQSLCIIITFQSDRYLVVSYFGLVALSYYGLTATVFNHLHMGLGGILPWLVPKFTKRHALHMDSLDIYHAANCLITAAALLVLLALSVSYPYLFKWLLRAETESQMHDYTQCFLAFEAFFALSIVPTYYLNAVGQERAYFHYMLLFSLTALAAMWVSIQLMHTPLAVVYGLFIACAVAVSALTILMGKIQTGSYKPLHAFYQLLPSMLTALFIFSTNLYLKAAVGLGALAAIYFMNLRGRRQQFIQLIKI